MMYYTTVSIWSLHTLPQDNNVTYDVMYTSKHYLITSTGKYAISDPALFR